ncbi:GH3 family domain-containing protein [Fulvivirga sediminis]|uniref:GH3 auxin-responsive promoter family protein n=1 Tax=Fulvivirga sediminis TaxID=2803949 RepID=A0A937JZ06_9BACT|nr:GH3 auxin-responsive promoter family protein [Fulvivirga sediminis]MBL3656199.1 GH3 auxin-responsive promoter family protein [Fulvivirga sediminis]
MPILGTLLKKGIRIRESLDQEYSNPYDLQKQELKKLLITASQTKFGKHYNFDRILESYKELDTKAFFKLFKGLIPIHNYNKMYEDWWKMAQDGNSDVCWPGNVKYFALSSGTSEASSKYIPITRDMKKAIQKTSIRQILSLSKYDLPSEIFQGGILMLGGSTHLNNRGSYFEGDLSGIQAAQLPFWFQHFYKPGKRIAQKRDWDEKLNEIAKKAKDWNISIIVGVPAWIQILMEKILEYNQLNNIHEIWPNLSVYVHGGVSFDPYRKGFRRLLGRDIHYIETYLASEGFIAFQGKPDTRNMKMVLNNGSFYEFVPFEEQNFDEDGEILPTAQTCMIDEVEEGKEYALLLSSCAGAWRYMIGDVVKIVSKEEAEIVITGRTKHFLSLCGEHMSVDNMNKAIEMLADDLNITIPEFTVAGIPHGTLFAHHWYIGTDDTVKISADEVRDKLDGYLKELNDDYKVERSAALRDVFVDVLPVSTFYRWMESKGKVGGQNKFPRVIKSHQYDDWKEFIKADL